MDKLLITRVCLLISLVILLITFNLVSKTDCQSCKLIIDDKELDGNEFMGLYFDRCITPFRSQFQSLPILPSGLNISG